MADEEDLENQETSYFKPLFPTDDMGLDVKETRIYQATAVPSDTEGELPAAPFIPDESDAAKLADSIQEREFSNGVTVETCTRNDASVTYTKTKNHVRMSTAQSSRDYSISYQNNGTQIRKDRKNGTRLLSRVLKGKLYYDAMDFYPSTPVRNAIQTDTGGLVNITFAVDGRVYIERMTPNVAPKSVLVRCKDESVRANDGYGNLIPVSMDDLPVRLKPRHRMQHQTFLENWAKNPDLPASQGLSTPFLPPAAAQCPSDFVREKVQPNIPPKGAKSPIVQKMHAEAAQALKGLITSGYLQISEDMAAEMAKLPEAPKATPLPKEPPKKDGPSR